MNGLLATTTCIVAGTCAALAILMVRDGATGEAMLFTLASSIAVAELLLLVAGPRRVVCVLVAGYAFLATFLVPIGSGTHGAHHSPHDAGAPHASAR